MYKTKEDAIINYNYISDDEFESLINILILKEKNILFF